MGTVQVSSFAVPSENLGRRLWDLTKFQTIVSIYCVDLLNLLLYGFRKLMLQLIIQFPGGGVPATWLTD